MLGWMHSIRRPGSDRHSIGWQGPVRSVAGQFCYRGEITAPLWDVGCNLCTNSVLLLLVRIGLDRLEGPVPRDERREKWDSRSFVAR